MHAAVVEHFGKPLVLKEVDIPSPGPGQILVKTELQPLSAINGIFGRLQGGDVPSRVVLDFASR
jgi:D-arabinose 1-dehydrogenase-like Zn-dependent alcohol dehydrogenase